MAKGRDQTQRVKDMIDQFMIYHDMGYGIPEIAKKFEITTTTIYSRLQEIAEKYGFYDRKELLERVHPKHINSGNNRQAYANFDEVSKLSSLVSTKITELVNKINAIEEDI